jgi:replicative DNA helicase
MSRTPPSNDLAETAVISCLMRDNDVYPEISAFLKPEHFAVGVLGRIYGAIGEFVKRGHPADRVTLRYYFQGDQGLEAVGGAAYLDTIQASTEMPTNLVVGYARTVFDFNQTRAVIARLEDTASMLYDLDWNVRLTDVLSSTCEELEKLNDAGDERAAGFQQASKIAWEYLEEVDAAAKRPLGMLLGSTTSVPELDKLLGGFQRGSLIVLAARPSMGKSLLAAQIGVAVAQEPVFDEPDRTGVVAIFSLEMSPSQWLARGAAAAT